MARKLTDGAEGGDTLAFDVVSGMIASTTRARSGSYAYYSSGGDYSEKAIDGSGDSEGFWRIGVNWETLASARFFQWFNGTTELGSLRVTSGGYITVYTGTGTLVGTSTITVLEDTWYSIELHVKIDDSSGDLEVKIDGILDIDFSGDTKPGTATTYTKYRYTTAAVGHRIYFDDLAYNDTTGSDNNSWCGDGHIIALFPNGAGDNTDFTPSAGSNYECVNEVPPNDDTDYVEDTVTDDYDLYELQDWDDLSLPTNVDILRVWPEMVVRDSVASGGSAALVIKASSEHDSTDKDVLTSYTRVKGEEYLVNPDTSSPWTISDIDALQVGPKVRS